VNRHAESQEDSLALRNRVTKFDRSASLHPHSATHYDAVIGKFCWAALIGRLYQLRDAFSRPRIYNQISEIIAGA